jgi:AraC-like DNA-binding protein
MEVMARQTDLVAEVASLAPRVGANVGSWPGLVVYRFTEPTEPPWHEIDALAIGIVAQGRKTVTADGKHEVYDQFSYLVLRSHLHFTARVVAASPREPFLYLVVRIEPALVHRISADMRDPCADPIEDNDDDGAVSVLDDELMSAVFRFLRSLTQDTDRRVLAPLYLQELVYRVLQREQFARMLQIAAQQAADTHLADALDYIDAHLAERLTVTALAAQVNLSPSAFSRTFREVTGRSPYQFIKERRLHRARELLAEGRLGVGRVSRAVGYASPSHFIKEFRARFGMNPRDFAESR